MFEGTVPPEDSRAFLGLRWSVPECLQWRLRPGDDVKVFKVLKKGAEHFVVQLADGAALVATDADASAFLGKVEAREFGPAVVTLSERGWRRDRPRTLELE